MILTILLTLFCIVYCDTAPEVPFKVHFDNNTTKDRFVSLLESVVKLNEERYNVLKKYYRLQEDVPTEFLRSKHFWQRYETKPQPPVVIIVVVSNNKKTKKHDLLPLFGGRHASKLKEIPHKNYYRRKWQKSCSKKAVKVCRSACNNAFTKLCKRFKCTSKAKRAIKKQCKSSCERDFSTSKYSDESESNSDSSGSNSDSDCS